MSKEHIQRRSCHQDALGRNALLTARFEGGGGDFFRSRFNVCVSHHDIRCVGSELSHEFLRTRRPGQRISGHRASGKRHGANLAMRRESKRRVTIARHDGEHILWPAGIVKQLCEAQGRSRTSKRRLYDDGVAGGNRRRDFLHQQIDRRIERRDARDHAIGHTPDKADMICPGCGNIQWKGFAPDLRQCRRRQLQEFGTALDFKAGHADRLADVLADQRGYFIAGGSQRRCGGIQPCNALVGRLFAICGEGDQGRRDRAIDAGFSGFRDLPDRLAALRSNEVQYAGGWFGRDRLATDEVGEDLKLWSVHVSGDFSGVGSACWPGMAPADGHPS